MMILEINTRIMYRTKKWYSGDKYVNDYC